MRTISQQFKDHLAGETTTLCTIWQIKRRDGTVIGFTDHNKDIIFNDVFYESSIGYTASAIKTSSSLSIDNLELTAPLGNIPTTYTDNAYITSNIMTDSDIQAGVWDYAHVIIMCLNYEDLSMGKMDLKTGNIGNITTGRLTYIAEFRGIQQPLTQQIVRKYTSACMANLGDSICNFDGKTSLGAISFTGSVTGYIDKHSWIDTSLNQTNSTIQKNISSITKGTSTTIDCTAHGFQSGNIITISGVSGMTEINGITATVIYGNVNRFSIAIDTSNFSNYVSGGVATLKEVSEYFKGGKVVWLTGKNAGISADIKNYRPNYVFLHDSMVYPIEIGDTYTIYAGCDKLIKTCKDRFDNVINYYGFNLVPGVDRLSSGT